MKRIICALLACLLLLCGCSAAGKDWQEQYDLGMRYLEDGDYEEAILAFSVAIEIDSSRPEAYMARAEAYVAIGDPEQAMKDYKKAQRVAKNNDDYEDLIDELKELIEELEEIIEEQANQGAGGENTYLSTVEFYLEDALQCTYRLHYNDQWLLTEVQQLGTSGEVLSGTVYTYDERGMLLRIDNSLGYSEEYVYDSDGLLTAILSEDYERHYTYDGERKIIWSSDVSGTYTSETTYIYDEQGRMISGETHEIDSSMNLDAVYENTYRYDSQGRLVETNFNNMTVEHVYYANARVDHYGGPDIVCFMDGSGVTRWNLPMASNIISVKAEGGVIGEIICEQDVTYLFTYTTAEENTADNKKQDLSKSPEYEIIREDRSIYDDGVMRVEHYYDRIVLRGDSEAIESINAYIEADMENFLNSLSGYDMESELEYMEGTSYCYYCTADAEVTNNAGGIFSCRITTFWFMGGVGNANHYGMSFDTRTGQPVDLAALFGMSEEALTQELKDRAWAYLSENCADSLWDSSKDVLYGYAYEDFLYYFQDGQLILTFPTYALSYGAAGSFTVPTGLYY